MKHKLTKALLLLPALLLASCGLSLNDIYQGDTFNSPVFKRNYYSTWDKGLESFKGVDGTLKESNKVFRTYNEFIKTGLDENAAVWDYFWLPKYDSIYNKENYYSYHRKMSMYDDTFNNRYLSKLYDGQMFCGGDYQLSRVQIDKDGFGQYFAKEGKSAKYFASNFKASIDFTDTNLLTDIYNADPSVFPSYPSFVHYSSINLTVSIYTLENQKITKYDYINELTGMYTNKSETFTGLEYEFFGFSLENLPTNSHIVGYSMNYTFDDPVVNAAKEKLGRDLDYSLMLYEVMFPFTSWN